MEIGEVRRDRGLMGTAQKILIVTGMLMFLGGIVTGMAMGLVRMGGAPAAPRYLTIAHEGAYMQGAMLLGVAYAMNLADLGDGTLTLAAWLLAIGAGLLFVKDILNWRMGVEDEFAEKSLGLMLGNVMTPFHSIGMVILLWGVIAGVS